MGKQKIVLVSRSFYPMNTPRSFRATQLVQEFCRRGYEVTVVTHHKPQEQDQMARDFGFDIVDLGPEISPGKTTNVFSRAMNRLLGLFLEYPSIRLTFQVRKVLKGIEKPDMLLSIAAPHTIHWGTAWFLKGKPDWFWVADCGDPYMGNLVDTFRKPFYFKYVEKWWCRRANVIAVPIANAIPAYYPEFANKIKVIPQGFNFTEVKQWMRAYEPNAVPTFVYAGNFIAGQRDPRPIIAYLNTLDTPFRFLIYTRQKNLIEALCQQSKGRIEVRDFIPREQLLSMISTVDFLLNIENGSPEVLPSKLIDYALSGRPILTLDSNQLDTALIDAFLSGDYSGRLIPRDLDAYDIVNVANQFSHLMEQ